MTNKKNSLCVILQRSFALLLFLLATFTFALAERHERVVDSWRPVNYNIALALNDQLTEITSARAEISVQVLKGPLKALDLDFGEMTVDSVTVNQASAHFNQGNGRLNVELLRAANSNDKLMVVVHYHGHPKDGLVLTNDKAGKPSATGDNWPDRVHNWIPCLDHPSAKATVNFTVTAPARDLVVANGQLTATRTNSDATRTWTYTESRPIPPYCMVIAVGEYAQSSPQQKTVTPLAYYVPQTDRDLAQQGFGAAPFAVSLFSERVAPYPYEKLALIVGATRFGGMENSSAIVLPSNLFENRRDTTMSSRFNIRRGLESVTAHEIAHQWFGDSVTESTWADLWLSEGFATYFAGLFIEQYDGEDAFRDYMKRDADTYFRYERERRAPIHDTETEDLFKLLNPNNYEKGAWVLHMLRGLLGDANFYKGIRAYYLAHESRTASTEDLREAMEKASGLDLKEFFARWIYGSGHPVYEVSWTWQGANAGRGTLTINLRQTQADAPFLTPLPAEIVTAKGTQRITLKPTGKESSIRVPLASQPTDVRIDPDGFVLKELVVKK
ncbi:MAG TPA: M1 family metallopeptidase [Pyrinomonadaceae bacterium]|nr:M1 family metallopeptidase [Pyrinomonadaceae bacterium]